MGLDVYLYQFKDVDTDAILELSRLVEEPCNNKEFEKWKANKAERRQKLSFRAKELGFPEKRFSQPGFGGIQISFPSAKHPKWPVGQWYSLSSVRELMEFFTEKNIYFVFPEAEGDPWFLRPDWAASRKKLVDILRELEGVTPAHFQDYRAQFAKPNLPWDLLEKVKPEHLATPSQMLAGDLAQIEVMIETLDHVLNHERPHEFLLRWSA